jgi:para-nitrobenzyl esterase
MRLVCLFRRGLPRLFVLGLLSLGLAAGSSGAHPRPSGRPAGHAPVVRIRDGLLRGRSVGAAQEFLGIPFALPPVGPMRFRAPAPERPWRAIRPATRRGAACVQFAPNTLRPGTPQSEDCLYLDVYRPAAAARRPGRPVMVWIHGGGDLFGSSVEYDAHTLAARTGAIVVVINYRLGVLGYLSLPGLDAEAPRVGSGNYATLDQLRALAWVRENIGSFGGDSHRVTIFGQSAGANSVCVLLASPLAAGLFQRAIIQSQGCDTYGNPKRQAQKLDRAFAAAAGCTGGARTVVGCLRRIPARRLAVDAAHFRVAVPVSGTPVEPRPSGTAIREGHWNRVPVLLGGVRWEGKFFLVSQARITAPMYKGYLAYAYGPRASSVLVRYPLSAFRGPFYALAAVGTDSQPQEPLPGLGIACLVNATADDFAAQTNTYRYEFNDPTSATIHGYAPPGIDMSNAHLAELNYLFDFAPAARPLTRVERPLAVQMQDYWGAFAWSGNPNGAGRPAWPRFTLRSHRSLVLSPFGDRTSGAIGREHNCGFWAHTPYVRLPPGP